MFRSALVLAVMLVALGMAPSSAAAQTTLVPNPACLFGTCDEETEKKDDESNRSSCPLPATLVCAGGAVVGAVGDAAAAGLEVAGDAVMGGLTSWVAGGAAWLLERAARLLDRSTRPALGSPWFQRQYRQILGLSLAVSLLFLLCAVLHATLRQNPQALIRSALLALPLSILLCFAAVTLVEGALAVTDWMSAAVLERFERDTGEFFADVGEVLAPAALTGNPLPGFLLFLGALVTALATFVVWMELIMREAAIYVAVTFLPLCFAGMVWEKTAHLARRLVELLMAIILAKLAIAVAVALAAGAMGHARGGEGGFTALMAGCAVMLIAALTPWVLLRLVPIAEAAGHLSLHRGYARAALGAAPGAQTAAMVVRQSVLIAASPSGVAAARHHALGATAARPPAPPLPSSAGARAPQAASGAGRRS